MSTDVIVEKEKQDECTSTPPRNSTDLIARHVASQYGGEYSSSPSSTTSSLNRGRLFISHFLKLFNIIILSNNLLSYLENSLDYKDSTGVNLHEFMVKTLKENPRYFANSFGKINPVPEDKITCKGKLYSDTVVSF